MYQEIDGVKVWGDPQENAVAQAVNCTKEADRVALMADHHLGYSVPIGGVVAYDGKISPSGVGFDIACGNKAVRLDIPSQEISGNIKSIMDDIWNTFSFGIGMKNKEKVEHPVFEESAWDDIKILGTFKDKARSQLGTIGSGNHYIDLFIDEQDRVWCGVHFGSRGFGHKTATHYLKLAGGKDGMNVDPAILDVNSELGNEYIMGMELAGKYAYAGRDWVCDKVAHLLGAHIYEEIHNHHNFAWFESHGGKSLWVVRKGATPAFPGQKGFVGGSMGENAVIVEGVESEESKETLYSTVHGAGRVMSRTQASGRFKRKKIDGKWVKVQKSPGLVSREMMDEWVNNAGVELRGAGTDESPHCYKRLDEVLLYHQETIKILHHLKPIGVAMAGDDVFDPYKD